MEDIDDGSDEFPCPPDYVTTTKRGGLKWIYKGHGYVIEKRGREEVMYWRCERKDELGCKGRIISQDDDILKATGHHSHTPEATLQEQAEVRDTIDNRSRTSRSTGYHRQPKQNNTRIDTANCTVCVRGGFIAYCGTAPHREKS